MVSVLLLEGEFFILNDVSLHVVYKNNTSLSCPCFWFICERIRRGYEWIYIPSCDILSSSQINPDMTTNVQSVCYTISMITSQRVPFMVVSNACATALKGIRRC